MMEGGKVGGKTGLPNDRALQGLEEIRELVFRVCRIEESVRWAVYYDSPLFPVRDLARQLSEAVDSLLERWHRDPPANIIQALQEIEELDAAERRRRPGGG